jgi:hypothetical protein
MTEFTQEAKKRLDSFLKDLQNSLKGCRSVDRAEVERNVLDHIDDSLAGAASPVDTPQLAEVLEGLGNPSQWIPEEELPWFQRFSMGLRTGPEDFRLAYLSIVLLALAALLFCFFQDENPLPFLALLFSFCFAQAVLSLFESPSDLGAQAWLVYPSLASIYVPVAIVGLFWTVPFGYETTYQIRKLIDEPGKLEEFSQVPMWIYHSHQMLTLTAGWWFLIGLVGWIFPRFFPSIFHPFLSGWGRKHSVALAVTSFVVFLVGIMATLAIFDTYTILL